MTKTLMSLDDLDAEKHGDVPFKFPFMLAGKKSGVVLHVLGGQSTIVKAAIQKLLNEDRASTAERELERSGTAYKPIEEDVEFAIRSAAARLVGWDGLSDPVTPENIYRLCKVNVEVRQQVLKKSDDISNFIPR